MPFQELTGARVVGEGGVALEVPKAVAARQLPTLPYSSNADAAPAPTCATVSRRGYYTFAAPRNLFFVSLHLYRHEMNAVNKSLGSYLI